MNKADEFKVGDVVECGLSREECERLEKRDVVKAKKLGRRFFMGRAAAYMHSDEGYVIVAITENGGLKLRGFVPLVSPADVQLSAAPVYR